MKIIYCALVLMSLCIVSTVTYAQHKPEITLYDVRRVSGVHEVFAISESTALTLPVWNLEKDNSPPLTIKQATLLAKEWAQKKHRKSQGLDIFQISIREIRWPGINNCWYYIFDLSRRVGNYGTGKYISVVILMNGAIVEPLR